MKLGKILMIICVLAVVGGSAYIAMSDIHVDRTQVTKTIPNDQFFKDDQ